MESTLFNSLFIPKTLASYKELVKENEELKESLYYAHSVQQGLMPQKRHFEKLGNPWFVFNTPAKIIGGDFYWIGKKGEWEYYAVGDCTGHSLSGAMLSSMAIGFLNYLVYSKEFSKIGEVLDELDKKWIEAFKHGDEEEPNNDWLEIAIVAYNSDEKKLQFASSKRKAIIATQMGTKELTGSKFPIGGWQIENNRIYQTQELEIEKPFSVYLFSDGFQDQFGGPNNKRLGFTRMCAILGLLYGLPAGQKESTLRKAFLDWKGTRLQTDDVCLMGVDFN